MRHYYKDVNGGLYNFKSEQLIEEEYQEEVIDEETGEAKFETKTRMIPDPDFIPITEEEFNEKTNLPYQKYDTNKESLLAELRELYQWFNNYDIQMMQYARCQRLGLAFESSLGSSIEAIDELAETKAGRIKETRELLKENS